MTVQTATGRPASTSAATLPELRERHPVDPLDVHVQDPAAGQADGEGVIVATPYAPAPGCRRRRPPAPAVDRTLDAAAGDASPRPRPVVQDAEAASRRRAGRGVANSKVATTVPTPNSRARAPSQPLGSEQERHARRTTSASSAYVAGRDDRRRSR